MHRDLKPSNVLVDNGEAKLADFGFCKKMKGEFEMTKSIVGSPIYMAPELLQGRYYCTKADIWSLGVLLYEMLHGKCPYEENSIPTLLDKIKSSELKFMPGLSLETKQLLEAMLSFNPSSRIGWAELLRRIPASDGWKTETTTTSSYSVGNKELGIANSYLPSDFDRSKRTLPQTTQPYQEVSNLQPIHIRSNMGIEFSNQTRNIYSPSIQPFSEFQAPLQKDLQITRDIPVGTIQRPAFQYSANKRQQDEDEREYDEILAASPFIDRVNRRLQQVGQS